MDIGRYNERITFTDFAKTQNSSGGTTAVTENVFSTWAKVSTENGTRRISANEQVLEDGIIIRILKNTERLINKTNRITWRGNNYQIASIVPRYDGSGKVLWEYEIIAKKQGSGATEISSLALYDENENVLTDENNNILLS